MIIVDRALRAREEEGRPIRVGMLGAGFMAQGLANQIRNSVPGMEIVAIYGRRPEKALAVFGYAGDDDAVEVANLDDFEDAVRAGRSVVTEDALAPLPIGADRRDHGRHRIGRARSTGPRSRRSSTASTSSR